MESWTTKKAEHRRIDAFELWCWRRLLRVPWTARRSNQSILKEISPGCSLDGLMLKLKLQYFGHLMRRADSFEKTLMLEKIDGRRRRGWQRMRWVWASSGSWRWTGKPGMLHSMGLQSWTRLSNWTELNSGHWVVNESSQEQSKGRETGWERTMSGSIVILGIGTRMLVMELEKNR